MTINKLLNEVLPDAQLSTAISVGCIEPEYLKRFAEALIDIYDFQIICYETKTQQKAVNMAVEMAKNHETVLDKVIVNAKRYATLMSYEDADPYHPNSFDVLAKVGTKRAREFIESYKDSPYMSIREQIKRCQDDQ